MDKNSIYQLVEDTVNSLKLTLVETIIHYGKTKDLLKIIIHHPSKKITSDDCTLVADIVSRQLDIDDPFERPYDLIVESPGLEREFKSNNEYQIFIGREIKLFLNENSDILTKEGFLIGTIVSVDNNQVQVKIDNSLMSITFEMIKKAKLYCDYDKLLKKDK